MNQPPGPRRVPVASIGKPMPAEMQAGNIMEQILGSAQGTAAGPMLDPAAFQGAPPWVAYLANTVQNLRVEVAAYKLAVVRRGLITEAEFAEAMLTISMAYEQQFKQQVQGLGRQMNQPPKQPVDPRRSPT